MHYRATLIAPDWLRGFETTDRQQAPRNGAFLETAISMTPLQAKTVIGENSNPLHMGKPSQGFEVVCRTLTENYLKHINEFGSQLRQQFFTDRRKVIAPQTRMVGTETQVARAVQKRRFYPDGHYEHYDGEVGQASCGLKHRRETDLEGSFVASPKNAHLPSAMRQTRLVTNPIASCFARHPRQQRQGRQGGNRPGKCGQRSR